MYKLSMVTYLHYPLNGSNIRLYRFTHFCRFKVLLCIPLRSSSFAPLYTRACNLNAENGPFVIHNVCKVAPVRIFWFWPTCNHTFIPASNTTLIHCQPFIKVNNFLPLTVESIFYNRKLGLMCCC